MIDRIFIGTKIIKARPMTAGVFAREVRPHSGIAPADDSAGYRVEYADGYVSWSPKNAFDEAYRPISLNELHLLTLVG